MSLFFADTGAVTNGEHKEETSGEPKGGEISIKMKIDHPEVVMVEDSMRMDSNALILDVCMKYFIYATYKQNCHTLHNIIETPLALKSANY